MKRRRFTEDQIIGLLKEHGEAWQRHWSSTMPNRISVADLCRQVGVSDAAVHKCKANHGRMNFSEAKRMKA